MAFDPYWEWLGIAPDRRPPTYYDLLGLAPGQTDTEKLRHALEEDYLVRYRRVRAYAAHPRHGQDANRLLDELAAARLCLSTPDRKAEYDRARQTGSQPTPSCGQGESPLPDEVLDLVGLAAPDRADADERMVVDLDQLDVSPEVIELLPEAIAWENAVVPLDLREGVLWVASSDPKKYDLAEKLRFALARPVRVVEAAPEKVRSALWRLYGQAARPNRTGRSSAATRRPPHPEARYCPHCGTRLLPRESLCLACAERELAGSPQRLAWQHATCLHCGGRLGFVGTVTCPHCRFDHALGHPPKKTKLKPADAVPFAAARSRSAEAP
jgi:curved DNA-binding protein CbpA